MPGCPDLENGPPCKERAGHRERQAAPEHGHQRRAERGCDRRKVTRVMRAVTMADRVLEDPYRDRPEMRATVVMVQKQIADQMRHARC